MKYEAHGEFDISVRGEIVHIRFFHNWNIEGAKAFFEEYQSVIKASDLNEFGVLSDLSRVEGGTPDAIAYFETISDWAQANGQTARALILNSAIKAYIISQIDKEKQRFPVRVFSDAARAFDWFRELGLDAE